MSLGLPSFAYLDFQTEAEQTAAMSKSEQHLDGRKLLIKNGKWILTAILAVLNRS